MSSRSPLGRVARVAAAGLLLVAMLPATASAAPSDESCSAYRAQSYVAAVPAAMRTAGTHRFEWSSRYTDLAGRSVEEGTITNQVTIDAAASAYPNTVLLRLTRNTTLTATGDVAVVTAMRPDQAANLYVNVSWFKSEPFFTGTFHLLVRYETSRNHWSAWQEMPVGPENNFCTEFTNAIWQRTYGWS